MTTLTRRDFASPKAEKNTLREYHEEGGPQVAVAAGGRWGGWCCRVIRAE